MGKERENSYRKMKRSADESHTQTHGNLIYSSAITDAFLDQKRVNVCEHAVKFKKIVIPIPIIIHTILV
jgi:hypothetical protein